MGRSRAHLCVPNRIARTISLVGAARPADQYFRLFLERRHRSLPYHTRPCRRNGPSDGSYAPPSYRSPLSLSCQFLHPIGMEPDRQRPLTAAEIEAPNEQRHHPPLFIRSKRLPGVDVHERGGIVQAANLLHQYVSILGAGTDLLGQRPRPASGDIQRRRDWLRHELRMTRDGRDQQLLWNPKRGPDGTTHRPGEKSPAGVAFGQSNLICYSHLERDCADGRTYDVTWINLEVHLIGG